MAPQEGLEPTTLRLTAECSAIELLRQVETGFSPFPIGIRQRPILPGRVQPSTFGAEGLNFCVRYGNRWDPFAIATGNYIIIMGLRSSSLRFLVTCPRYFFLFLKLLAACRLSLSFCLPGCSPFRLRSSRIKSVACYVFTLCYSRPLTHLDNCTLIRLYLSDL